MTRFAVLACSLAILAACTPASADSGLAILVVVAPADGAVVPTPSVQVRGTAPAGVEIVQDISFAGDKRTSADAQGNWVLTVDLDEGANDLTFRIGSDNATAKTIRITYDPSAASAQPTAQSTGTSTPEPSASPTRKPRPTPTPRPTPRPTPPPASFGDGDQIVGADIRPGTYRTREAAFFGCYWERLKGFSGGLDDIIANGTGSGYFVVTIERSDAGFSSRGCGEWSADLSRVKKPGDPITEDGTYIVGVDVAPGTWRSRGGDGVGCYAARLRGFGGTLDQIISNDVSSGGGLIVTIAASDKGFESTGCGRWQRIS
jgi:hypothetical protein